MLTAAPMALHSPFFGGTVISSMLMQQPHRRYRDLRSRSWHSASNSASARIGAEPSTWASHPFSASTTMPGRSRPEATASWDAGELHGNKDARSSCAAYTVSSPRAQRSRRCSTRLSCSTSGQRFSSCHKHSPATEKNFLWRE